MKPVMAQGGTLSYRPMQITQQWSAAEFSPVASCESMWLIRCLPVDCGFSLKTYCVKVKGLIGGTANTNEFSFKHDQVCLHFVNKAVKILIGFDQQLVNCCGRVFLINTTL